MILRSSLSPARGQPRCLGRMPARRPPRRIPGRYWSAAQGAAGVGLGTPARHRGGDRAGSRQRRHAPGSGRDQAGDRGAPGGGRAASPWLRQFGGTRQLDIVVNGLRAQVLGPTEMLPAPGQGALALEVSTSLSRDLRTAIATLDDPRSRAESLAERGFLAALEAGCTAPVGARAVVKSVRDTSVDLTLAAVLGER